MTHTIYAIALSLFATANYATAAQKPATKARTEQEKRNADAEQFANMAAAMGGKMLHSSEKKQDKPKITDTPTTKTDLQARL